MHNKNKYWRKWYIGVLLVLVLQVILYYFITISYA